MCKIWVKYKHVWYKKAFYGWHIHIVVLLWPWNITYTSLAPATPVTNKLELIFFQLTILGIVSHKYFWRKPAVIFILGPRSITNFRTIKVRINYTILFFYEQLTLSKTYKISERNIPYTQKRIKAHPLEYILRLTWFPFSS